MAVIHKLQQKHKFLTDSLNIHLPREFIAGSQSTWKILRVFSSGVKGFMTHDTKQEQRIVYEIKYNDLYDRISQH